MPTTNPRINVTVSVSLDNLVGRLASFQRVSKSQVLRELLEEVEPALQRVAALMDATLEASEGVRQGLARQLERDHEAAADSAAVLMARFDRRTADLVSQAEAIRGKRPGSRRTEGPERARATPERAGAPVPEVLRNPPTSNRGVKSAKAGKGTPVKPVSKRHRG